MTASMEIWPRRRQLLSSYGGGGGDLSPGAADAALVLTYVGASLSLLGSGTILTCFAALPSLRRFSFRLVAYLSMCDCLSSAMLLLGDPRDGSFACSLQSFVSQFSTVASVLWTAAIAFVLWKAVVNRSLEAASIPGLERRLHALVWGCSFVLMLLPLIDNSYGEAGTWCWIKNTTGASRADARGCPPAGLRSGRRRGADGRARARTPRQRARRCGWWCSTSPSG